MASHLAALRQTGTRVFFLCGNRDFLIGRDYCDLAGMERLEEPAFIDEGDGNVLLMHGDTLCTDDTSYQRFRRKSRNPEWQGRVLSKPIWLRRLLARLARWLSRRHTGGTEATIMDVNDRAVEEAFRDHGVRRIIHGHTHRVAIHDLRVDHQHRQRIVLGDWGKTGSVLRIDAGSMTLLTIARDDSGNLRTMLRETAAPLAGTRPDETEQAGNERSDQ